VGSDIAMQFQWRGIEEKVTTESFRGPGKSFCKHLAIASMEERYLHGNANVLAFMFKGIVLNPDVE
jgi:hypothetical protein